MGDSAKMRKNFKRYLELKPKAPNRKEIKKFL
jgi:hypothetical protein